MGNDDFAEFYDLHIHKLVGALTATLANPAVAQDAAQEAMLKACQRWKKVSQYQNPMGWVLPGRAQLGHVTMAEAPS